jgi:hypothetical protein
MVTLGVIAIVQHEHSATRLSIKEIWNGKPFRTLFSVGLLPRKRRKSGSCFGRDQRRQGDDDLTVKLATSQSRRNSTLIIVL